MSRPTRKVLALMVASSLAILGFFITRPAFAGTNGQELKVCQQPSESYRKMRVQGYSQDNDIVESTFPMDPGGCGTTTGFFWVSDVFVTLTDSADGTANRNGTCYVPTKGESPRTCQ